MDFVENMQTMSIAIPSKSELATALKITNFLSAADVDRRARLLHQDLTRLQIEGFQLLPIQIYPGHAHRPEIRVAEYAFGSVSFSLENAKNPASVRKTVEEMAGTAINREDVLYLSQVFEMAHRLIPSLWLNDRNLMKDVTLPSKHLDTLNEIWWLGRWNGFSEKSLQREAGLLANSDKTVDWRFQLHAAAQDWTINLEVKRIISSIGARAYRKDHFFYAALRGDGSVNKDDPRQKFRRSSDNEINILAITWFDEVSAELEAEIQRFLDEDDKIDMTIIWAPGDHRRDGWARFFPRFRELNQKRSAAASILLEPNDEDRARIIAFLFPRTLESIQTEVANL